MKTMQKTPLEQLIALEKHARDIGFNWPDIHSILRQAHSECDEIQESFIKKESPERLQEEIGDLLHAVVSLCLFSGFSVDDTLMKINKKFDQRMNKMMDLAQEQGLSTLEGQTFEFMLTLWDKAKK